MSNSEDPDQRAPDSDANSTDPDQKAFNQETSDLGLHYTVCKECINLISKN